MFCGVLAFSWRGTSQYHLKKASSMVSNIHRTKFSTGALVLLISLLFAGCGGGGETGPQGLATLVRVESEAPGSHCSAGGSRIVAGSDTNGDATLDAAEVSSTQYVCNAAPGAVGAAGTTGAVGSDGFSTLVLMINEPSGLNCPEGGQKLTAGKDANRDSILDAAEVTSTGYVCNGTNGIDGARGINSLLAVTVEAAGAHCAFGGNKVSSGLDSNSNGTLDSAEITSSNYLCNGSPGPTGAAGPSGMGVVWTSVTNSAVLAQPNSGYLADSAAEVTVTLPSALAIGDVVRVSGVGSGGWNIAQQAGQVIATAGLVSTTIGAVWTPRESSRSWHSMASSADGSKLVAVDTGGLIYTSTDSGVTWTPHDSNRAWWSVASSADGSKLVAAVVGGQIYTSTDSGQTWTARDSNRGWVAIASSADGVELVAAVSFGQLYTSNDSGATWTARESTRRWQSVASSADAAKLGVVEYTAQVYTSIGSGVTWTARDSNRGWYSVASSADGTKLVAAVNNGQIYTSADSGLTWRPHGSTLYWGAVASSADGMRLVAIPGGDHIYISTDSGLTWTARDSVRFWGAVTVSADGTKLLASEQSGPLYTSVATTSLGVAGSISGEQYEAIELQYVGSGVFSVLSYVGSLVVR